MGINLAIVTSSPGNVISGGQISVRLLSKALITKGIKHTIFSCEGDSEYTWECDNVIRYKLNIFQKHAQSLTITILIAKELFSLERKGINIFHIYNTGPIGGGGLYKLLGGKSKVVATLNSYQGVCPISSYICNGERKCNWINRCKCIALSDNSLHSSYLYKCFCFIYAMVYPISAKLMKLLDGYIALSDAVKKIYINNGYDPNIIKVIPNMSEINNNIQINSRMNDEDKTFKIIYVGRLEKNKGVHILARAFQKFNLYRPNSILTLVGDGPLLNELQTFIINSQLEDKIILHRKIPHSEILSYYKDAHVFILPGLWSDPFPRTLLEALSAELPCIVSNIGSPPEVIGNAGLIFPPGDEDALTDLLVQLYDEPDLRLKLSSHCKERLKCYSPNKVITKIIQLYSDVLNNGQKNH